MTELSGGRPLVVAPVAELGTTRGATMLLLTVERWRDHVVVRVAAAQDEASDAAVVAHRQAMAAWGARHEDGTQPPPEPAAELLMGGAELQVADDLGTAYDARTSSAGGTGSEWQAEWRCRPPVPVGARELRVRPAGLDDAREVRVPLAPDAVRPSRDG